MRPGSRDAGTTLVEVVVAMSVLSLVAAVAMQAQISIAKGTSDTVTRADRVAAVRLAALSLESPVRSADALTVDTTGTAVTAGCVTLGSSAASNCVRVTTQVSGRSRCLQWQVLADPASPGTAYVRTRGWSPAWNTDGDVEAWRTLASGLVPPATTAVPFTVSSTGVLQVRMTASDPRAQLGASVVATTLTARNLAYTSVPAATCAVSAP